MLNDPITTYARVIRYDPTRTLTLRNSFATLMKAKFRGLIVATNRAINEEGLLGTDAQRPEDRLQTFMSWFSRQTDAKLFDRMWGGGYWYSQYLTVAYQRGVLRGRQELRAAGYAVPTVDSQGGIVPVTNNNPFHRQRLGLLLTRMTNDLAGITNAMQQQVSRILAQGLISGLSTQELARQIMAVIKGPESLVAQVLGRVMPALQRAIILTKTEVIRAHHLATVQEYRGADVAAVTIVAEWLTAGDNKVCGECAALEGKQFVMDDIEGMIPLHAQCRCVALPVGR